MILPWLLYASVVGLLFAAAASLIEIPLRERGWPLRPVWVAALLALLLVPALAATVRRPAPEPPTYTFVPVADPTSTFGTVQGGGPAVATRPAVAVPAESARAVAQRWIVRGWALASVLVGVSFAFAFLSLLRSRRRWRRATVDGRTVWISPDTGPAVVGAFPGSVVIPEWLLGIPSVDRELILRHEEEHVAAGDAPVLFAVLLLRVILPWNPALWWIGRSLGRAIEIDCDRRVLAGGADPRAYARVLLDVSERGTAHRFAVAALSEPPSFLERRIRLMIAHRPSRIRAPRLAATVALALAAAVTACNLDRPEAQPIVATGFSMPPAEAEPGSTIGPDASAAGVDAPPPPRLPALSQEALSDTLRLTFRRILETRHPEVVSGALGGEPVNLYVLLDGNGDVIQSAVDTERRSGSCTVSLSKGLGIELDRPSYGSGGCGSLDAGIAGPSRITYFWGARKPATEQQRLAPTGPYQVARLLESSRPSREMLVAAVREQFPEVYERGLPQGETLWFVGDAYHRVVHSGRGWEYPSSIAAQAEIQRILPGIALSSGLMGGIRSAADTPIGIYWATLAAPGETVATVRPDPFPAARTYAVTTSTPGRQVQIRLEGEASADPRAFRISGKFTNDGGVLNAVTPFTFIVMSAAPFQATLRLMGEGEIGIETEAFGRRAKLEARVLSIARGSPGAAPTMLSPEGARVIPTATPQ